MNVRDQLARNFCWAYNVTEGIFQFDNVCTLVLMVLYMEEITRQKLVLESFFSRWAAGWMYAYDSYRWVRWAHLVATYVTNIPGLYGDFGVLQCEPAQRVGKLQGTDRVDSQVKLGTRAEKEGAFRLYTTVPGKRCSFHSRLKKKTTKTTLFNIKHTKHSFK